MPQQPGEPVFHKEKHVKYSKRCLKTFLPTRYTSQDANRMMLAAFTLISLDLLGATDKISPEERRGHIEWVYSCQHPCGGFRAFPGTSFGPQRRNGQGTVWDPASLAGTYFALSCLLVLRDDLKTVRRKECLEWLAKLQLSDGSVAELLGPGDVPAGGHDLRYCYFAVLTRDILRSPEERELPDLDIEALLGFISRSQTYEGGFAQAPGLEAHAGTTYCGAGSLQLLLVDRDCSRDVREMHETPLNRDSRVVSWLLRMQTSKLSDEEDTRDANGNTFLPESAFPRKLSEGYFEGQPPETTREFEIAGFCGRCNKPADTCYSFWAGATVHLLGAGGMVDHSANRRYLLDETQHVIGGFSKLPGGAPDILHSCLGLAALALQKESGLQSLAPEFCFSEATRRHLESAATWRKSRSRQTDSITQSRLEEANHT